MEIIALKKENLLAATAIWNEIVEDGNAFPQEEAMTPEEAEDFFDKQSYTGVAIDGEVVGLYILHPNNVGRCGHICNASYAVKKTARGKHVGEALVLDCMTKAKMMGFRILQFNAVVESNVAARRLYEKLGFIQLGTIEGGFRTKEGAFVNICPYYKTL